MLYNLFDRMKYIGKDSSAFNSVMDIKIELSVYGDGSINSGFCTFRLCFTDTCSMNKLYLSDASFNLK